MFPAAADTPLPMLLLLLLLLSLTSGVSSSSGFVHVETLVTRLK
jgi:hypothetical protein